MAKIVIYIKAGCSYCIGAKQLLTLKKLPYEEISLDLHPEKREEMERLSGRRSLPQIFINDKSIGGYDDLSALATSGELALLLT